MGDNVFVNADRTAVVDETDPGKKWQMRRKEAVRLGLLPEGEAKPQARRNQDTTRPVTTTAPPEDTERTFGTTVSPETKTPAKRSPRK